MTSSGLRGEFRDATCSGCGHWATYHPYWSGTIRCDGGDRCKCEASLVDVLVPTLARLIAEAEERGAAKVRGDAWEEGYEAAIADTEARSAPPGSNGPIDPSTNPYRAALTTEAEETRP